MYIIYISYVLYRLYNLCGGPQRPICLVTAKRPKRQRQTELWDKKTKIVRQRGKRGQKYAHFYVPFVFVLFVISVLFVFVLFCPVYHFCPVCLCPFCPVCLCPVCLICLLLLSLLSCLSLSCLSFLSFFVLFDRCVAPSPISPV